MAYELPWQKASSGIALALLDIMTHQHFTGLKR